MDKIPWIKRAVSRQSRPAIRNTGQTRWVKRYSHQITRGWNAPITSSDAAPTTTPSQFSSIDITSRTSYHRKTNVETHELSFLLNRLRQQSKITLLW